MGVAEDFLHLVIRVEYCFGGRRNEECSLMILEIQMKFLAPLPMDANGGPEGMLRMVFRGVVEQSVEWRDVDPAPPRSVEEWAEYKKLPFESHAEYIAALKRVSVLFPDVMMT